MVEAFQAHLETAPKPTLSINTALKRVQRGTMAAQVSLLSKIGASIDQIHILVSNINRLNGILSRIGFDVDSSVSPSITKTFNVIIEGIAFNIFKYSILF